MRAPEFANHLQWFNVDQPLSLQNQRGKIVLLDFWTYCCINCMHVLPDLHYLEKKYPDSLTVIGIHSPKFPNERVAEQLAKAIQRYGIQHPIAHDPTFSMWQEYGVHAWPTLVLLDTEGKIVGAVSGEGQRQKLDTAIQHEINRAQQNNTLQPRIVELKIDSLKNHELAFPGKILATDDRIYISDSGHQQIVEANWQGKILQRWGSGETGLQEGDARQAQFNNPQGLIKIDDNLYVADTDNHALRQINLLSGQVKTIAGTGKQGVLGDWQSSVPSTTALNSPWDLAYQNGLLFIAMAGNHQIWSLNLAAQRIGVWAGSGYETLSDGLPAHAAFAQPSGLTLDAAHLYVADSEISAVRQIDLNYGTTKTLVGTGLFDFGYQDGIGRAALLQHPLGISWDSQRNVLWLADTYNHRIRQIDLSTQAVSTLDIGVPLNEPGGISYCNNTLWIANTNLHNVVKYDLITGQATQLF